MISAAVLTKNEEENIAECLGCLQFCDEILVVDDYSTDKTREIAKSMGAKVYKKELSGDFAAQRNFALEKASNDWVFFVDADERVTKELASEVIQLIDNPLVGYKGFYVRRKNFMWGKEIKHGEMGNDKILRIGKKDEGKWVRKVHETWRISGQKYVLKNSLLHYPHKSLKNFLTSIRKYTKLHALANYEEGKHSSIVKIIFWPFGKFVLNYFGNLGFLDKERGLVIALVMSLNSYLAWSTLWLYQRDNLM